MLPRLSFEDWYCIVVVSLDHGPSCFIYKRRAFLEARVTANPERAYLPAPITSWIITACTQRLCEAGLAESVSLLKSSFKQLDLPLGYLEPLDLDLQTSS